MKTRPPLPRASITLTLPTLTAGDRTAVVSYAGIRICREPFLASPAGVAAQAIVTALSNSDATIALSLTRPDWGAVFRALGDAGRETVNVPARVLVDLAAQINTADRTANPTLPLLQNS